MSDKCQVCSGCHLSLPSTFVSETSKQKQMEWLTNQFQGNASVEDSLVYGISRAARKACAGITFILFSLAASAQLSLIHI